MRKIRRYLIPSTILFAFIFSFSWLIFSLYRITSGFAPDFSVFWVASRNFLISKNPYLIKKIFTIFAYPPHTLIFFLPFAILPYKLAQTLFVLLSFIATILSYLLSLKIVFKKNSFWVLLGGLALIFLSFPIKFNLGMGQNNTVAFFLLLSSYYFYKKGSNSLAGLTLGVSFILKPILGFFIAFYILKKKWRMVTIAFLVLIFSITIIGLFSNLYLYPFYATKVVPSLLDFKGREIYYNQGISGFISRLVDNIVVRKIFTLVLSLSLVTISFIYTLKKKAENLVFSLFVITTVLVDTLSWQHHFVWLIFPFVAIGKEVFRKKKFLGLLLISISYILVSWNFKSPENFSEFPVSLILSNNFYGAICLLFLNLYYLKYSSNSTIRR